MTTTTLTGLAAFQLTATQDVYLEIGGEWVYFQTGARHSGGIAAYVVDAAGSRSEIDVDTHAQYNVKHTNY